MDLTYNTLISPDRLDSIIASVKQTHNVLGVMAELGVYKGGSAKLIAEQNTNKELFLIDSFKGLSVPSPEMGDKHMKGEFADTTLVEVKKHIESSVFPLARITYFEGFVPYILTTLPEVKYSFVHMDMDLYLPTKNAIEYFYPRMSKGGVMLFDDYKWQMCDGVTRIIDEFFSAKPEQVTEPTKYQAKVIKL